MFLCLAFIGNEIDIDEPTEAIFAKGIMLIQTVCDN